MLYVHGVENGNDCGQTGVHGGSKNYVPNAISPLILTHNQAVGFHHPPSGDTNIVTGNVNQWIGHVGGTGNGELGGGDVNQKDQFDADDLSVYGREAFCGQRESENVRSFSVNKLLQINNGNHSESTYMLVD